VPSYYDSLLGKLSVWAPDRAQAIARGDAALRELLVDGLTTNIELHEQFSPTRSSSTAR